MSIWQRILFFVIVFGILFGLQFLTYITFRRFLKRKNLTGKFWNAISIYPYILFLLPFIYILIARTKLTDLPEWFYDIYIIPFFVFQAAVFFIGLYLLVGKIIKSPFSIANFVLSKIKYTREKLEDFKKKKAVVKFDNSRRQFITASAVLVSGYAFIGAGTGVLKKDDYEITYREIKIKNLPPELKGFTITLVSDFHCGPFMEEDLMKDYCDVINNLNSDLILIPGDLTNSDKTEAVSFANAFKNLKAKHGVYASLGNHDYFSDPNYISDVLKNETPIKLLRNDSEVIQVNGNGLCIMGIEDTRVSGASYDEVVMGYFNETIGKTKEKLQNRKLNYENVTKILLYHKPYLFPDIKNEKIDLMLSGHTHGGQIVLAKFGNVNLSIAASVSRYISGLYREGDSQMYVSRGVGVVGLPIRLNCPPEITKITLI
ncbi:MAG: metallophosphoesterase [Ignavibacteria bacterium]|nr:metallophosphoesterase [Ignavibacteria bacterium]